MDSSLHRLYRILHHSISCLHNKIHEVLNSLKAFLRRSTVVNGKKASGPFSKAPELEESRSTSSESVDICCTARRIPTADSNICDPEDVVGWIFSGVQYDADRPILIDASDPSRFVTKSKALRLVTSLAGAFEPCSTVCVHLPNDVVYPSILHLRFEHLRAALTIVQVVYPVLVLGILASRCRWTGVNTAYTSFELEHHFRTSATRYVITMPEHESTVECAMKNLEWEVEIILFADILSDDSMLRAQYKGCASEGKEPSSLSNCRGESQARRTLRDLVGDIGKVNLKRNVPPIRPDDIAVLQSTSGTTGLPKMAARTHRSMILESKSIEDNNAEKGYEVRRLFCTPIFHSFSTPHMVITPLRLGIPTYIMRRYDDTFAQKVHDFGITETAAPPPMLKMLQEQEGSQRLLQGLRMILCGGAPLVPELRNRVLAMFETAPRIVQVWGMTESGWLTTFKYPENDSSGSVGRANPGLHIKVSSDHLLDMPAGRQAGELLAQGPQLMAGYFGNEQASKDIFVDGWMRTGDVGFIENGKVYIVDRCKDLIKVNGWQVAPAEIEAAVMELPGVHDAAAIAAGHGVEEYPLLFIVKSHGADVSKEDVVNHLRSRMAKHKVASIVVDFIELIPRNPSGKILRKVLRETRIESNK